MKYYSNSFSKVSRGSVPFWKVVRQRCISFRISALTTSLAKNAEEAISKDLIHQTHFTPKMQVGNCQFLESLSSITIVEFPSSKHQPTVSFRQLFFQACSFHFFLKILLSRICKITNRLWFSRFFKTLSRKTSWILSSWSQLTNSLLIFFRKIL